jgi:hypothetical protein
MCATSNKQIIHTSPTGGQVPITTLHRHVPNLSRQFFHGLNSGAQDSFNLAWRLALVVRSYASMTILDSYNEEHLPAVAEML